MPNLIITKSCNLNCKYCFAGVNEKQKKTELSLSLYLLYLKHLRISNDTQVRLLGGEPLLHSKISEFIKIGKKGGFNVLIFSNLCMNTDRVLKVFGGLSGDISVNININKKSFYRKAEIDNLFNNIKVLKDNDIDIRLSFLVNGKLGEEDFIFDIANRFEIKKVHLKPYNYNGSKEINTNSKEYGLLFYNIIKKYGNKFKYFISCGFSEELLLKDVINELKVDYDINIGFGCSANGGKYDINYDGKIFRCFALNDMFKDINYNIKSKYNVKSKDIIKDLNKVVNTKRNSLNCLGYIINN